MSNDRTRRIEEALNRAFSPEHILVKDQSHLHAGHAGARDGKGHFAVQMASAAFEGKSRLERHRMVHEALNSLLESDIHALSLRLHTPEEMRNSGNE